MSSRLLKILTVTVLALCLVPVVAASAVISQEPFQPAPLVTQRYGQVQPAVEYPWVVYKSEHAAAEASPADDPDETYTDIYAYNLKTGQIKPICTVAGEQSNPDISGTKVVYSDNSKNPTSTASGYCDIYVTDLATGSRSVVCTAVGGQGNPSIDGDVVVWTDGRAGGEGTSGGDIYMKNLKTGIESVVATSSDDLYEPVANDGYAVWLDQSDYSIKMLNLTSKEITTVATTPAANDYVSDPFVAEGYVAYQHQYYNGSFWEYRIEMYNIAAKTTTVISKPANAHDLAQNRWHPEIGGGWVVWPDRRTDGQQKLFGYHIKSRVERQLVGSTVDYKGDTIYAGRATVAPTDVAGKSVVVWHDHRNENLIGTSTLNPDETDYDDLYGMYLTDRFGPVITVTGVADGAEYTDGVKPVVTCAEGAAVTTKITCNGVAVSNGTTLSAEGKYTLVATAHDSLGNPGRVQVDFVINKDEAPAGSMMLNSGAYVINALKLSIGSKMTDAEDMQMRYSVDGNGFSSWADYAAKVDVEVADEGFHDVVVEYQDASGNVASRWDWVYVVLNPTKATLGTPQSASTVYHARQFSVSGTFAPTHIGPGSVRIYKYKYVSGAWRAYGYSTVAINSTGTGYSGKISLPSAGKWRLRAYHADSGHAASLSKYYKTVVVK